MRLINQTYSGNIGFFKSNRACGFFDGLPLYGNKPVANALLTQHCQQHFVDFSFSSAKDHVICSFPCGARQHGAARD